MTSPTLFEQIPELRPLIRRKTLIPGAQLFAQGEVLGSVYLVRHGIVKLTCSSPCGKDTITALLFPGDVCDLMAVFDGQASGVSAAAVNQLLVEVECVPREAFLQAMERNPQVFARVMSDWRGRLAFQRQMMVAIAVERVEQRALRALTMLAEKMGQPVGSELEMSMPLTRQEFSELIGTTMESAIRTLSQLRKTSVIRESQGTVALPSLVRMRELCGAA